jgi:hypothetical protein
MDRIAILAEDHATRPVVVGSSSREVELRWPGRGRQSHPWEVIP